MKTWHLFLLLLAAVLQWNKLLEGKSCYVVGHYFFIHHFFFNANLLMTQSKQMWLLARIDIHVTRWQTSPVYLRLGSFWNACYSKIEVVFNGVKMGSTMMCDETTCPTSCEGENLVWLVISQPKHKQNSTPGISIGQEKPMGRFCITDIIDESPIYTNQKSKFLIWHFLICTSRNI